VVEERSQKRKLKKKNNKTRRMEGEYPPADKFIMEENLDKKKEEWGLEKSEKVMIPQVRTFTCCRR